MHTATGEPTIQMQRAELQRELAALEQADPTVARAVHEGRVPPGALKDHRARKVEIQDTLVDLELLQQVADAREAENKVLAYGQTIEACESRCARVVARLKKFDRTMVAAAAEYFDLQTEIGAITSEVGTAARSVGGQPLAEQVVSGREHTLHLQDAFATRWRDLGALSARTLDPTAMVRTGWASMDAWGLAVLMHITTTARRLGPRSNCQAVLPGIDR